MATKPFDASKYLTDLNGRDYLEVKWRLLWLRTEHPDAIIETELIKQGADMALFRARVTIPAAGVATGWGSETAEDFRDFIEKAETKALGRALAALGYGTQFCEDFDFSAERPNGKERASEAGNGSRPGGRRRGQRVVDSPVRERSLRVIRDRSDDGATSAQLQAIHAIAREGDAEVAGVEERCREAFGCLPGELSKRQASEFIDLLRKPAGEGPAERPSPATSAPG